MVRTKRFAWPVALLAAAAIVSCYDPAVRERVVLRLLPEGGAGIQVETLFKVGKDLNQQEQREIHDVLDRYDQGRDPWLRGFERAGANRITHSCRGADRQIESIQRQAELPSVEALVKAMPDAIANVKLEHEEGRTAFTLGFVHIDSPETIRDNWRRLEKEIAAWSRSVFRLSTRQCDLYDYLAERAERRLAVLRAMTGPDAIKDTLEPRETALLERLDEALEIVAEPPALRGKMESGREPPVITRMSFAPFDHDLCVQLPPGALDVEASPGLLRSSDEGEDGREPETWCFERLTLPDLAARLSPAAEPPWPDIGDRLGKDAGAIEQAPFSCQRYDDARGVELRAWEEILPRSWYELTWSNASLPSSP